MNSEQVLLTKWRDLSQDQQKQVLNFIDFLYWQDVKVKGLPNPTLLNERLQQIRSQITSYSKP